MQRGYTLSARMLFDSGQSGLDAAGRKKLDDIVRDLRDVDIERISNIGHADRMGSAQLNQKVSLTRAESVKAYLVSQGIDTNRIAAAGEGETQPLTAVADCQGPSSDRLVACLQPDRRVNIEVIGTNRLAGVN